MNFLIPKKINIVNIFYAFQENIVTQQNYFSDIVLDTYQYVKLNFIE